MLRRNDFAAMRINWQDKPPTWWSCRRSWGSRSTALCSLTITRLNASASATPGSVDHLTGDPVTYAATLRGLGADVLSFGHEDQMRTAMHRSEADRRVLQSRCRSLEGFLESLEMQMDIEVGPQNLPRAAELTQRTNQFNLTTRRYTQDDAGLPRATGP